MAYVGPVQRWDIYWADLNFPVGSEQGGERRPVLIISNDGVNAAFNVITQIPLTKFEGKSRKVYPFEVLLPPHVVGTGWTSIAMPQQIRTIDKTRLLEKIGTLSDYELRDKIESRILEHLGIAFDVDEV